MKKTKFILSLVNIGVEGARSEAIYDVIHDMVNKIDPSQLEQISLCIALVFFKGRVDKEDILFMQTRIGPYYTTMIVFQIAIELTRQQEKK